MSLPSRAPSEEAPDFEPGLPVSTTSVFDSVAGDYALLLENAARASMRKFAEERTEDDTKSIAAWITRVLTQPLFVWNFSDSFTCCGLLA